MKKYTDKKEILTNTKNKTLIDILKESLSKAVIYEQALKNNNTKTA